MAGGGACAAVGAGEIGAARGDPTCVVEGGAATTRGATELDADGGGVLIRAEGGTATGADVSGRGVAATAPRAPPSCEDPRGDRIGISGAGPGVGPTGVLVPGIGRCPGGADGTTRVAGGAFGDSPAGGAALTPGAGIGRAVSAGPVDLGASPGGGTDRTPPGAGCALGGVGASAEPRGGRLVG